MEDFVTAPAGFLLAALAMLLTITAIVVQLVTEPDWAAWASLVLVLAPVALARSRTVPDAVRLGVDADPPAEMLRLARTTLGDHVFCFVAVASLLAVQLVGHFV